MTAAIDLARKQGYSDQEIGDYLAQKDPRIKQALDQGYSFDEISSFLTKQALGKEPQESAGKGAARAALQVPLGILEGTGPGLTGSLVSMAGAGEALADLDELEERLPDLKKKFPQLPWPEKIDREKYLEALQTATQFNPLTVGGLGEIAEATTGLPLGGPKTEGQEFIRKAATAGKFAPGGLLQKSIRGVSYPAVSNLLQKSGLSEPLSDFLAFVLSQVPGPKGAKGKGKVSPEERAVKPPEGGVPPEGPGAGPEGPPPGFPEGPGAGPESPPPGFPEGPIVDVQVERFPSGLTKPKAVEAKKPGLGIITPAQQERALGELNAEASKLTKAKFEESFPTAKKIEEGFDYNAAFKKGFGELETQAAKANPSIDTTPFMKFLREEQSKYRGIPTLDKEARKIVKWIEDFRSKPVSELKNLLKVYRSVNRELKGIYDRAKLSGVPDHYVNFLSRANQEIANAIRETLPKDSLWMKRFDSLNKVFKNFRDAEKIGAVLRPLLKGEPTAANLRKIANDPKLQRLLELKMGKDAAAEIIQIAKDLEAAPKRLIDSLLKKSRNLMIFIQFLYYLQA